MYDQFGNYQPDQGAGGYGFGGQGGYPQQGYGLGTPYQSGASGPMPNYGSQGGYHYGQESQMGQPQQSGHVLSGLANLIPAISTAFAGNGAEQNFKNISNAQTNTDNPMYQQIYGQQKQQGQQNLANEISQLQGMNRSQSAMGRTPLFSTDRGSGQIFRGLTQGYQDVQNNAANQTHQILNQSLGGAQQALRNQQQQSSQQLGGYNSIANALKGMFGL